MANALSRIVTNTEAVHDMLQRQSDQESYPYFRFNVERDFGDIGLEDWKKIRNLTENTIAYMGKSESETRKIRCAKRLIDLSDFRK